MGKKRIKDQYIVVPDKKEFRLRLLELGLEADAIVFLNSCIIEDSRPVKEICSEDIYGLKNCIHLDKYKFNFYDFCQPTCNLTDFNDWIRDGFNKTEINMFNGGLILKKPYIHKYVKYIERDLDSDYYKEISNHFKINFHGDFMQVDYLTDKSCIPYMKASPDIFISEVIQLILEYFHKGLWLNGINTYSLRYNGKLSVFDPDIFYVIKDNDDIPNNLTENEFIEMYIDLKGRPKTLHYYVSHPENLTKYALEYLYNSWTFNELLSQKLYEMSQISL